MEENEQLKCAYCDERFTDVIICNECDIQLCSDCDLARHKNRQRSGHQRRRKRVSVKEKWRQDKVKEFRSLMFGVERQQIESAEFMVCTDQVFTLDVLQNFYNQCRENPRLSLVKLLITELRDACRLKEEFDNILCCAHGLGPIENATVNDFIICFVDACKEPSQKQSIYECLAYFDSPIVLGHAFCSGSNLSGGLVSSEHYGLHLSELYQLIFCGTTDDESKTSFPIVFSLGTEDSQNKTKFLNMMWKCKFEEWSKTRGLHHSGQLELLIGGGTSKRHQHLLDLHGTVSQIPATVLKALFVVTDLVIIHCNPYDFDLSQLEAQEEFKTIMNHLVTVRSAVSVLFVIQGSNADMTEQVQEQMTQVVRQLTTCTVQFDINFLCLTSGWQDNKQQVLRYHEKMRNVLASVSTNSEPLKRLYESLCSSVPSDESITKTDAPPMIEVLRQSTRKMLEKHADSESTWFPLHSNSSTIAFLDDKLYESPDGEGKIRLEMKKMRQQRGSRISGPVQFFRDHIASKDKLEGTPLCFMMFQRELSRKFQPYLYQCRKELKELKDEMSAKPTKQQRDAIQKISADLMNFDIAGVHFIRELIERGKDKLDDTSSIGAVTICQNELLTGRSVEIVNGDSLTISTEFLESVFGPIFLAVNSVKLGHQPTTTLYDQKKPTVETFPHTNEKWSQFKYLQKYFKPISSKMKENTGNLDGEVKNDAEFVSLTVIGVESSGKSTLWNELWNSNFPVAHGKCSRGLWSSLVQVKDGPVLLINDTEGIMSPLCVRPRFDQKLVLLAFALSDIVVVNVKGEGEKVLIDLLKLVIYAAHKLSMFHRPQIVFAHRDVMGVKDYEKGSFKNIVLGQLHDACEAMQKGREKIHLEKIIDTKQIHSFDLPSAISEPQCRLAGQSVYREERTAEFILKCRELRQFLITLTKKIATDESRQFLKGVSGECGWIRYVNHIWDLAKQNASLWTFASVNEMLQRQYIEKELDDIIKKHVTIDLHRAATRHIDLLMSTNDDSNDHALNFPTVLTQLQAECQSKVEKALKAAIAEFPVSTIPVDVAHEYQEKAKRIVGAAIEEQRQILHKKQQHRRLQDSINEKFQEVEKKIYEFRDKNLSAEEIEGLFYRIVQAEINEMEILYKDRNMCKQQFQVVELYCSCYAQYEFAKEHIQRYAEDGAIHRIATQLNNTYWENVTTQTAPNNFQQSVNGDESMQFPVWAALLLQQYGSIHSPPTVTSLYRLQQRVFEFLWIANMKDSEKVAKEWKLLLRDLCMMVDQDFVIPMYERCYVMKPRSHKQTKGNLQFQEGFYQTVTNVMHTFACMMFYYFLQFHNNHQVETEIEQFKEICYQRKNDVILRARHAKNASEAARNVVNQIFDKILNHTNEKAVEYVEENMRIWTLEPKALIEEVIEKTFGSSNVDEAFNYIVSPLHMLKNFFTIHFDEKISLENKKAFQKFCDKKVSTSSITRLLQQISVIVDNWKTSLPQDFCTTTTPAEMIVSVSRDFKNELSFLTEGKDLDAVNEYLKNTTKNTSIDQEQFLTEFSDRLLNCHEEIVIKATKVNFPTGKVDEMRETLWVKARGCEALCPYCNEKCSAASTHVKHCCDHHMLQAFRGWRDRETQNPTLRICNDPFNFTRNYKIHPKDKKEGAPEYIPFQDHVLRYYPEWIIVPNTSETISDKVKSMWLMLRDKLSKHFKYNLTTPPEWEELYRA